MIFVMVIFLIAAGLFLFSGWPNPGIPNIGLALIAVALALWVFFLMHYHVMPVGI